MESNFLGATRVVQRVLPAMRAQAGATSSLSARLGAFSPPRSWLSTARASRAGGFRPGAGHEVAPFGIEVTLSSPAMSVRTSLLSGCGRLVG